MQVTKQLTVLLGSYNRKRFLRLAIDSIRKELSTFSLSSEIIVVDGGSTDGSVSWLVKQKDIITVLQHNRGKWKGCPIEKRSWGYFMNLGFKCAQGKYICMLSDDCLVVPGAIHCGVRLFEEHINAGEKIGAIPFYWRNWPEEQKYRVGYTPEHKYFVNHGLFLKKALEDVNYIDEELYEFYHADTDLCLKLWNSGYCCLPSENSFVEHFSHANLRIRESNLESQRVDYQNYLNKWGLQAIDAEGASGGWSEVDFDDKSRTVEHFVSDFKLRRFVVASCNVIFGKITQLLKRDKRVARVVNKDDAIITKLKKKFKHNEREFVYKERTYVVDCLYCHAVPGTFETIIRLVENLSIGLKTRKILNLGGGICQVSKIFEELGCDVFNVDLLADSNVNNYRIDLNKESLPFEKGTFDIVLCQEIVEHLENPWKLLRDVSAVLKNDGVLLLTTPNILSKHSKDIFVKSGFFQWFTPDCHSYHINPIPFWELELITGNTGFNVDGVWGSGDYYMCSNSDPLNVDEVLNNNECVIVLIRKQNSNGLS